MKGIINKQSTHKLRTEQRDTLERISVIMSDVLNVISITAKASNRISGLTTGFSDLDGLTKGLNNSDMILIASRPGMGKTSIALNIALHVAKESDKTVAVFSLDMSREQLATRLLSASSYVDGRKLHNGRFNTEEWKHVEDTATMISETKLMINDVPYLSVEEMREQCRSISDLGLVIIDYMQLVPAATKERGCMSEDRALINSKISRAMKAMARELDVPVVCLSQLNRDVDGRNMEERRPMLSDLCVYGSIERDADVVIGLFREFYYDRESEYPNIAECIVLKNHRGETGSVNLHWNLEITKFSSLEAGQVE